MDSRPAIALVPVEHDLDVTTVSTVRSMLDELIDDGCRRIVLNMAGARYVDSAGMAMLLGEVRRMRSRGGLLSMTNVSDQVLYLFKRTRLVDFAPVSGSGSSHNDKALPAPTSLPLWRTVVPIRDGDLGAARARVNKLLERTKLSSDERFDAALAVGEAMGNAIDHGCADDALVSVAGYADRVVMEVCDHGPGFDAQEVAKRPVECCAERGRGIKLMQLLADSVSIDSERAGTGTTVRIVKLAR